MIAGVQQRKIFPLKLIPEYPDRDKKLSGGSTDPVVRGKPAAGDNTVHMDMVAQFLVPGVEDLYDPGCAPRYFLSADNSSMVWHSICGEGPIRISIRSGD